MDHILMNMENNELICYSNIRMLMWLLRFLFHWSPKDLILTLGEISHSILDSFIPQNQRRRWHPTPVLLPGKSHRQRSLVGCGPWGRELSDTTEWLPFHFSLSCIGEGNGNPLQCSCLKNPRDGGAWWAAVYGVTQSQTRLKWLSSRSPKIGVE